MLKKIVRRWLGLEVVAEIRLSDSVDSTSLSLLPTRGRRTDVGYDVKSIHDLTIHPGDTAFIHTGIELSVPRGWYWTIEGRSSLNKAKVFVVRPIVDATYTGEVMVVLSNQSDEIFVISKGDRVAQIILHRAFDIQFKHVDEFSSKYNERGRNGWGSTGR